MVARIWHGYSPTREHADAYEAMLKPELLPGVSKKKGYRGSHLMRRDLGDEIEFITILFFDSLDDIKALTGPDYETAVIPAERRQHLSRFDARAAHYEVPSTNGFS
jgi:antibiotic biosynthesis monooxygenase (ABM) superfamily enzyme